MKKKLKKQGLNIIDFGLKKYLKALPKHGFLYRISTILECYILFRN